MSFVTTANGKPLAVADQLIPIVQQLAEALTAEPVRQSETKRILKLLQAALPATPE